MKIHRSARKLTSSPSSGLKRALALGVVAVLGLTACGGSEAGGDAATGEAQTLTVYNSFVLKGLDPAQVYEATGVMTVRALYDTLVTFKGSDVTTPVGQLAESFTTSDDAKTFTFVLRSDAKFGDGSPVTSEDVVFSLNRLKNLKGSPAVPVSGLTFEAKDDKTVVVTSDVINPNVPTILAMPSTGILNSELAKAQGATDTADAVTADKAGTYLNTNSLGSGAYNIESFDAASQVVLTAKPDYWGTKPTFGRVVVQNMDVQNQKLTMSKEPADTIALDLSGDGLDGLPAALTQSGAQDTLYQLRFSVDPSVSEVTANPDFIKAFRASIDYAGVAALFGKSAQPAAGLVPTAFPGALDQSEAQKQDLDLAAKALPAGGLEAPTVSLLYPSITYRGVDLGTVAAKVQSDALKAGINVELNPAPIASFLDQRKAGKVALSLSPQSLNYPVAASMIGDLMPGGGAADAAAWTADNADAATVAAAEDVATIVDRDKQIAAIQEWQRLMNENSPYIPLAYNSGVVVASSGLTGADYAAAGWQVDIAGVGRA